MHPRLLKTFLAVARHRNITRAAREVHLAQSSVSDQIQSLENELGVALFIRSRHGLDLTAAGEALKPYAEEILQLAEEARIAVEARMGTTATMPCGVFVSATCDMCEPLIRCVLNGLRQCPYSCVT